MSANAMGTRMSAVNTDMRFVMISAMKTTIMMKARTVSITQDVLMITLSYCASGRYRIWIAVPTSHRPAMEGST